MSNLYYTFYQLSRRGLVIQTISETLFFMSFHIPSMGFKSGLFPGQSRTLIPWTTKYFFIDLAWWHGAPSCMNVQSHLGYQSLICGSRRLWRTCLYWCWFIFPSTTYSVPMPLAEMTLQIITLVGCFTVFFRHSGRYFSSGFSLCRDLSLIISSVDSSEKQTQTTIKTILVSGKYNLWCLKISKNFIPSRFGWKIGVSQ